MKFLGETWKVDFYGNIRAYAPDFTARGKIVELSRYNSRNPKQGRANAKLVEAAPDMFKACQAVVMRFAKEHHIDAIPDLDPKHPVRMCYEALKHLADG